MSDPAVRLTRRQRQVLRQIDGGLVLLAESTLECWLFDGDRPVERISTVLAERLVLRGLVRGSGTLTPLGRALIGAARP